MAWPYAYTPQIWPSVFMIFLLIVLAGFVWRQRRVPGALSFFFGLLFAILMAAGSVLEYAAVELASKIAWVKFQTAWHLPAATAITCFILEYVWPGRWLTRRNLVLLAIVPLLIIGLILTDDLHHLVWGGIAFERGIGANIASIPFSGPAGWLIVAYIYLLGMVNLIGLIWLSLHSPKHRWPVVLIIFAQISGRLIYTFEKALMSQSALPFDVLLLGYLALFYTVALFGFRLFDPVALASQTVMEQFSDGILVLDPQGRVASLNPAAAAILGLPGKQAFGRLIREILPSGKDQGDESTGETEINLEGPETRNYLLATSLLKDWRGQEAGRLLLLHDVTEQRLAQAQLLEQQRALAMLNERERLARELHDSLGQAFAFVNTQGQTIRRLLSRGDIATADEYASRLVEVAREADVDIRESILGLRTALSGQGFFPVLDQFLVRYRQNYGIHTEFEKPETMQDGVFEPLVEVQLLRILQETLTNVRKHAGASCVRIVFAFENHCATVTVQDNGRGFDPDAWSENLGEHVGLRVMRERAEDVGGSLWVDSSPGAGTRVFVRLPVKGDNHA